MKVAYISITAHYIDEEFALFDHIACETCSWWEPHYYYGFGWIEWSSKHLRYQGFSFDKIIVVAKCGSNIVTEDDIFSKFNLLGCIDHKIAYCLTSVLNKIKKHVDGKKSKSFYRYLDEPNMTALYALIDACKSLVAYFKRSNFQSKLSKTSK